MIYADWQKLWIKQPVRAGDVLPPEPRRVAVTERGLSPSGEALAGFSYKS